MLSLSERLVESVERAMLELRGESGDPNYSKMARGAAAALLTELAEDMDDDDTVRVVSSAIRHLSFEIRAVDACRCTMAVSPAGESDRGGAA